MFLTLRSMEAQYLYIECMDCLYLLKDTFIYLPVKGIDDQYLSPYRRYDLSLPLYRRYG